MTSGTVFYILLSSECYHPQMQPTRSKLSKFIITSVQIAAQTQPVDIRNTSGIFIYTVECRIATFGNGRVQWANLKGKISNYNGFSNILNYDIISVWNTNISLLFVFIFITEYYLSELYHQQQIILLKDLKQNIQQKMITYVMESVKFTRNYFLEKEYFVIMIYK